MIVSFVILLQDRSQCSFLTKFELRMFTLPGHFRFLKRIREFKLKNEKSQKCFQVECRVIEQKQLNDYTAIQKKHINALFLIFKRTNEF